MGGGRAAGPRALAELVPRLPLQESQADLGQGACVLICKEGYTSLRRHEHDPRGGLEAPSPMLG